MAVVGVVVNGVWTSIDDGRPAHVIDASISDIDNIVLHLGAVVRLAQGLAAEDQRRVRDFVRAALATLEATTSLPKSDQRKFERSLREDARKI